MKILHYFLGFPPYRTGGLTKFAYDLMSSQVENNNDIVAIWPGKMNFFINKNKIELKKRKSINGIENYELINPLPVPLDEGIIDIEKYTKQAEIEEYICFLKRIQPEVIHIHTLMGMHKEFIEAAKICNIKMIYTTHDYFGICPKATLYRMGKVCDNDFDCKECIRCNYSALSIKKIQLMQSPFYRKFKNSALFKILRRKHRESFFEEKPLQCIEKQKKINTKQDDYKKLRRYYIDMLEKIDTIHFNSSLTKEIYSKYINVTNSKIISITHNDIGKNMNMNITDSEKIRFTFLGSTKPYKGFYLIKRVLDELYVKDKNKFELNIFGKFTNLSSYMNIHEQGFKQKELPEIFSNTDILLAPSTCYETFGFTVLEALSYGIPVIISDNVGAKDIIGSAGIIVKANDVDDLKKTIEALTKEKVKYLKNKARNDIKVKKWKEFCIEIEEIYGE